MQRPRGDRRARETLIDNYSYLVKITAGRIAGGVPPSLDREDLISAGVIGLIKSVARAHLWLDDLATGRAASLQAIAEREAITEGYVRQLLPLAFLAPTIVEAILKGEQLVDLTAARLTGCTLPLDWTEQQRLLGS